MKRRDLMVLLAMVFVLSNCNKKEEDNGTNSGTNSTGDTDVSVLASKFYTSNTTVTVNDNTIIITSKGVPDHKSAYYSTSDALYEAYNAGDFRKNPNSIVTQNLTMTIPRFPEKATNHDATPLGPIGIAVNSVSIFNQYAPPGDDLENEIPTFDQWEGHPQQQGMYHYHLEPTWLTNQNGNEAFVGFLADGFPVYGTHENGRRVTNADLDEFHGHTSATPDFPNGIYHYHVTDTDPYINGNGYYGTAGTISR